MADDREPNPSAAKAAVAQQKPRDNKGRFLSGEELAAYQAQQQQVQFSAERQRLEGLFGKQMSGGVNQIPIQQQIGSGQIGGGSAGFAAILQANKPRGMASQLEEDDKWAVLLGKKRRGGGLL